jgi:hypothetical protein
MCGENDQLLTEAGALLGKLRIDVLYHVVGVGDEVAAHLQDVGQRLIDNVQDAEQDKELEEHGEARSAGIDVLLLIQLHLCLLHLLGFVLVLLPQLLHLRIQALHFCRVHLLFIRDGEEDQLGKNGEQQDRKCVVVHPVIDKAHNPAKRLPAQII